MRKTLIAGVALILAACAQIPPSPQEIEAKKFETVPDRAVVYIVQGAVGPTLAVGLALDDNTEITTWTGTFYRWVVAPGAHRIQNTAPLNASIKLQLEAGKIYFVEQWANGWRGSVLNSRLNMLDDGTGRQMVRTSTLCCNVN
jgi:hypothetical protein